MSNTPKHIFVIRLSAMGDVAMLSTVLRIFLAQNPQVKITMLSHPFLGPLFSDIPHLDFFAVDTKKKYKGILGIYKLYKEMKTFKIDAFSDMHNVLRSKILRLFFVFSPVKMAVLNKGRKEKKKLTKKKNKKRIPLKNTHERYADVLRALNFVVNLKKPIFAPQKNLKNIDFYLSKIPCKNQKKIGIAPFASFPSKMYPLNLMEEVVKKLNDLKNVIIFLFAAPSEKDIPEKWAKKYQNVFSVAEKMNFEKELCLISHLDLMVSMDSANGHLAALFNIQTLTIWGVTHPATGFAPFGQAPENNIFPNLKKYPFLPCSVYGNKAFKGYENVTKSIAPEKIIEKILERI